MFKAMEIKKKSLQQEKEEIRNAEIDYGPGSSDSDNQEEEKKVMNLMKKRIRKKKEDITKK